MHFPPCFCKVKPLATYLGFALTVSKMNLQNVQKAADNSLVMLNPPPITIISLFEITMTIFHLSCSKLDLLRGCLSDAVPVESIVDSNIFVEILHEIVCHPTLYPTLMQGLMQTSFLVVILNKRLKKKPQAIFGNLKLNDLS